VKENIPDIWAQLNALPLKKHFINGSVDYLAANPINIEILIKSLRNADLEIPHGAGHMFFNKDPWTRIFETFKEKLRK
jgi:hypothetical protein